MLSESGYTLDRLPDPDESACFDKSIQRIQNYDSIPVSN
jgi:hypothetical protein